MSKPTESTAPSTYVKAMPLKERSDVEKIKGEIEGGNILIVKITPLAMKNIEEVKNVIDELKDHIEKVNGDIARLGEERIVITPTPIKIWRKKAGPKLT
jgi:SepF-like predicted cell division protein (DUF552 family)